jgi:hypothetical protein
MQSMKANRNLLTATMPTSVETRKARFRAALALAGMTQESWAESENYTPGYLSNVLSGRFESMTLWDKIDDFTKKHLKSVA